MIMAFDKHNEVLEMLGDAQSAEDDMREKARENEHFLHKDDGQWEPSIIQRLTGRPRYTLDKCNPIIDAIAGEIEQTDFAIRVRPSSNEATEDNAEILAGMIRSIENFSNASDIYMMSARKALETGFDAWMIDTDYVTGNSFDQDLVIRRIPNAIDCVWFDPYSQNPDRSDSDYGYIFKPISRKEYKSRFPKGSEQSVTMANHKHVYNYKPDFIVIAELFYLKEFTSELVLMNDGSVYEVDDKFKMIADELAQQGITVNRTRKRKKKVLYRILFDGKDWLNDESATVFDTINIVPIYGNFNVSENKVIYRGAVDKLKDPQRIFNYTQSRIVEEVALSPKNKMLMTRQQSKGNDKQLREMNVSSDPVLFYNHVEGQPQPYMLGGSQVNPSLLQLSKEMNQNIIEASGIFSANQGNSPNQSGVAIELQQNKGDSSTYKYFRGIKRAILRTGQILVDAIPKVYDTERTVRLLGQDGTANMTVINTITDSQTGEKVPLNDLSKGAYDVVCDMGESFKNRQQQTVKAFTEIATIDPSIVGEGKDILLKNIRLPGMELLAKRVRKQFLEAGVIPDDEMTDDEKKLMEQLLAQAEQQQASNPIEEATIAQVQANAADIQSRAQERQDNALLKLRKQELDEQKFAADQENKQIEILMKQQAQQAELLNKQADTLEKIYRAIGANVVVNPETMEAYQNQSDLITDIQQ